MKKVSQALSFFLSIFLLAFVLSAVAYANDEGSVHNANNGLQDIKERIEVKYENGYEVTIVTKVVQANLDEYVANLKKQGKQIFKVNSSSPITINYMQEDHLYGSGAAYSSQGDYGSCWTNDLLIGLDPIGGKIQGDVFAWSNASGAVSKPRVELTTWGIVGGSYGVIKEYTFTPTEFGSGVVSLGINQNLTGAIAYYSISLYGDHKKGSINWTSNATLKLK